MAKKRSKIEEQFKWDLSTIFKDDSEFETEYNTIKNEINNITLYKGKIVTSSKNLLDYLNYTMDMQRKVYKLYYYAHLKYDEDTTNTKYQKYFGMIRNLLTNYEELKSFEVPEFMSIDYNTVKKFYKEVPELKKYEFNLENLYRFKSHTLSEKEEKMLSRLSKIFDNPELSYSALTDSDIEFGNITVDGKDIELTESNYSVYIRSNDRNVRKQAFTTLFTTYSNLKNTITSLFKGNVESLVESAKIRNYSSSLEASLFDENIDINVYDNLIDTVSKNMDVIYKYFKLKKEVLKLEPFTSYDIYVDMVPNLDKKYTFEEAKQIVLNALKPLGENYIKDLNKAFDERWIDIYPNKGKRTGAYSSGFYDTNPFVLLNFEGRYNDVSTLAHELGHSMHTYYSCKNNDYNNSGYQIFVAEVASTVNELLLANYMLNNSKDKEEKKYILNQLMELYKATIYRQTMFAEFEKHMHSEIEKDIPLTHESISDYYFELNKKYFGDSVELDDLIRYEWERIPHFYYNFYVYKYAIGLSCATKIVNNILTGVDKDASNYLKFLSSGGSDYPINELKLANIDVESTEVIESAIKYFEDLINKFKELM